MRNLAFVLLALVVACSGQQKKEGEAEKTQETPKMTQEKQVEYAETEAGNPIVAFHTTMGDFDVEVFAEDVPIHSANFLKLVKAEYYDDNIFHRVIADFMIQTGDPTGTGGGGPGYWLEQDKEPFKYKNKRSYIAMAQTPEGQINGSQFYILVADADYLDDRFPCFGKVIAGMDVVDAISKVKTDKDDRPIEEVRILTAKMKPVEQADTSGEMTAEPADTGSEMMAEPMDSGKAGE
jgi:peptidylprolyl isomerase